LAVMRKRRSDVQMCGYADVQMMRNLVSLYDDEKNSVPFVKFFVHFVVKN
jgi:hypothetical protein